MFLAAKRTGFAEGHLRIQPLVSGRVDDDPPVFQNPEIRALKHPVLNRADKNKFHVIGFLNLCCSVDPEEFGDADDDNIS